MRLEPWTYPLIFAGAALLAWVLTPMALRLAIRTSTFDRPGGHKSHTSPVPYLGGLAIVIAFSGAVLGAAALGASRSGFRDLAVVIGLAVVLAAVGLADDLRGLGPLVRLSAQILVAVALYWAGVRVELFDVAGPDAVISVIWLVGITNAFNLLDNMDGLSAGVAGISAAWFFVIAAVNGQYLVAALSLALAGCAVGFLRHNFHPARIYMGDAGSLFIGLLLAVLGVKLRFPGPTQVTFMVPILVLGVAIFDTTLVTVTRLVHRRSPLQGGRDHVSHRLVAVGIPVPVAVSLIYGAAVALGWVGLITSRVDRPTGLMILGLVVAVAGFVGTLLALVPVYEESRRAGYVIREADRDDEAVRP